jgi:hypothetical protein
MFHVRRLFFYPYTRQIFVCLCVPPLFVPNGVSEGKNSKHKDGSLRETTCENIYFAVTLIRVQIKLFATLLPLKELHCGP